LYLLGVKKFQATPRKQDLGISWGFFSKFPTSTPVLFTWEFPGAINPEIFFALSEDDAL